MNGGPIEVCPRCRYDLRTLPRNYRCPECGFEYDESMRVWTIRTAIRPLVPVIGFISALLVVKLLAYLQSLRTNRPITIDVVTTLVQLAALLILIVVNQRIKRSSIGFIVTCDSGVIVKRRFRFQQTYQWDDLYLGDSIWNMDLFTQKPKLPDFLGAAGMSTDDRRKLFDEILRQKRERSSLPDIDPLAP